MCFDDNKHYKVCYDMKNLTHVQYKTKQKQKSK